MQSRDPIHLIKRPIRSLEDHVTRSTPRSTEIVYLRHLQSKRPFKVFIEGEDHVTPADQSEAGWCDRFHLNNSREK